MLSGYNRKILRVHLTNEIISTEEITEEFCRQYLGGSGFVAYFLLKELEPGINALDPQNKIVFALGPLTGAALSGASRNSIGTKSPLTGGIVLSEVGEHWGVELKKAGFDAIIVEGKSERPVYLWVHDGQYELRDASHLWGKATKETQQTIRQELGDAKIRVASIGPGGENQVKYSCIMNGLHDAAGRGGAGAVMGSKNLKAIAVRGQHSFNAADPGKLKTLTKWFSDNMAEMPIAQMVHEYGTGAFFEKNVGTGNVPVHNFRDGVFPNAINLDPVTIKDTIRVDMQRCYACVVRCKKVVAFDKPYSYDSSYGGPEYETLASLGSNCGISDLKAVCKGHEMCNAMSLDTISIGSTIAFAMECFENGLLTIEDTDGIDLRFGNENAMLKMIELIAHRQGIGDLLAEGTASAASRIGKGAEQYAMHVKGLDPGMHEPRLKPGLGLGFMVNPHGADHCCNIQDTLFAAGPMIMDYEALGFGKHLDANDIGPQKVALFRVEQLIRTLRDSMLMCWFCTWPPNKLVEILNAVTGWETGIMEVLRVAERVQTMARMFNVREGFGEEHDALPERFFEPKTNGALAHTSLDREKMIAAKQYYYVLMGWDQFSGIPLQEKLEELELTWIKM